jgi:tetratricopeptide (TPR) repeat protein
VSTFLIDVTHTLIRGLRFWKTFWIDATNDETIKFSYQTIAGYPEAAASGVKDMASVIHWLSEMDSNWLLIFDNADGEPSMVSEYLPSGDRGNVLITSRNPGMKHNVSGGAWIEVEDMAEEDAISLLLEAASLDNTSEKLRQASKPIVKELCFLPLAVDQAGAAIAGGLCDMDDYLQMYSECRQTLLAHPSFKGASNYGRAVYTTWELSFLALEAKVAKGKSDMDAHAAESAIVILQTFAFFHFDGIVEDIFRRAAENPPYDSNVRPRTTSYLPHRLLNCNKGGKWDMLFFREGIRILISYSLIKKRNFGVYSMHPLVHCWIRDRMLQPEQQTRCMSAKAMLAQSITFQFGSQDYAFRHTLPHMKANEQYANEVGVTQMYDDDIQMSRFALVFYENGYWNEAEKLQVDVMELRKRLLGAEHPDTWTSMVNLADTYRQQGRWNEAEKLQVDVVDLRKRLLGAEHPDTLRSMANLAAIYHHQGRWNEAERLQVDVMEFSKRLLGAEHPDTLTSLGNLAATYHHQGRWNEAEKLQVDVVELIKRLLGAEHPDTLRSMANLAATYMEQGRWNEAERLQVDVMELSKRLLGAEHPSTLTSMGNLAATYKRQGRWTEAEKLQVNVMELSNRLLGTKHPDTLTSMGNLAATYMEQGRWNEAEKSQVDVVELSKRLLGAEHPDTWTSMANLAATYREQGRWNEAEKLEVDVLELRRRLLGVEHPDTLSSMANLAATYCQQGRWNEAGTLDVDVMELCKRLLGAEHPHTLKCMGNLATTYQYLGRWDEAEKLEVDVMGLRKRLLGAEHPDTLTSMANLAATYRQQGRWNEAEALINNIEKIRNSKKRM